MAILFTFGQKLQPLAPGPTEEAPDWKQCDPKFIRRALNKALKRPGGGWYVVNASRAIGKKPCKYLIDGKELVAYRSGGKPVLAAHACPHMAGPLSAGRVERDELVCPWHGLHLPSHDHKHWQIFDSFDDGVLTWVRLGSKEEATPQPILPQRPESAIIGIIHQEADCEPQDIVANRLDPWHGHHYHPHTFARLQVTKVDEDELGVRVAYRVAGPFCVEVDAVFFSPEPRSIVMKITAGEGAGSIVETHATPIAPGRSAVTEVTMATSERLGFKLLTQAPGLIRPMIEKAASRLWVEDLAYAERTFFLRRGSK